MQDGPDIARLAALIGDLARANMLTALMEGRALTASELAEVAGVSLPTASGHLTKLAKSALVTPRKEGRHKYFALADGDVAATLEALMGLAKSRDSKPQMSRGRSKAAMREARSCYNHLAGRTGVQMYQSLLVRGYLVEEEDTVRITPQGYDFMMDFGIDMPALTAGRATMCRACRDWTERSTHLSGSLGRALFSRMLTLGWLRRDAESRHVWFTPSGKDAFSAVFPDLPMPQVASAPEAGNVVRGRFSPPRRSVSG